MPPAPKRISPTKTTTVQPTSSVLDRIKPVGSRVKGIKMSIYGIPKVGKTRLACTFPAPLLLIGFEDGTESVVGAKGVDFVQLEHTDEFMDLVNGPVKEGKYKSVVVDTATKMRDMKITEILGLKEIPVQKNWRFAQREQWMECAAACKEMLSRLFDVANNTTLNVIIIAGEKDLTSEEERKQRVASDLIKPDIGCSVGKSLADFIDHEVDYIGQMCKREERVIVKTKIGKEEVENEHLTGKKVYSLRVGTSEVYRTGFRQHLNTPALPDFIDDPTYEKIKKLIGG